AMVLNGCETATALGITGLFSNHDISQISSGEKAGELDKIFKIIVHDYENRLDTSIKIILKLVEPVMIIIVGIFVCIIAVNGYKAYYNSILSMF
ncbi:MAG: type II secretion system F family protein, partial [Candidatus Gastranaerophilales bacterium]|nr:type II secretion system F family protein [Candidatus Gastranaerophilales bacterium]